MSDAEEETSVQLFPLSQGVIRQIYALACTSFEISAFRQMWEGFGWTYTPASDDEFGFQVQVADELALKVAPRNDQIDCAILPFCYWEEYEREWHDSAKSYRAERRLYDRAYEQAIRQVQRVLGSPFRVGEDAPIQKEVDRYRYAVWQGSHALLILQQCAFDVQIGLEINIWLEPCTAAEFRPTSPLIDWLNNRHIKL